MTAVPTVAIDGAVRARHEDFVVDEVPAYLPSGEGTHLFVRFEKTGTTTPDAVRRIATALGADPRAAGFAGLKDKHAVTTQWASFEGADAARLDAAIEGVRVIEAARHGNKLRTGHLRGNRFTLLLRGAEPAAEPAARACLDALAARGVPAYFGPQRFGHDGGTLAEGARWIFGGRRPRDRFRQKLLASAVQSAVFNHVLAARVRDGLLDAALDGDLLQKTDTGGLFLCDDPVTDTARAKRFELSGTGPMVGPKMREPEREARAREQAALTALGVDEARVRAFGKAGPGTRRPLRFRLEAVDVRAEPEGLRLAFTLPAGGYATVVLRELLRREVL
ncbi:MAG: tRNA pseudouridine(13) synthase TruD [Sandaracinaceae bacterium]|nr:tRNA pseudouridine(13) synthase TruD [Sandaracinaceae bacterium]